MATITILGRKISLWVLALAFVVLGLLAYAPYLDTGFAADDFIFINMLEGAIDYNPWTGFWSVPLEKYQGFTQLWWRSPEPVGAFFRPIPSWVISALYAGFGRNALPYHVTSILVHSLAAFSAFLVLRKLSGRMAPALLAAFLFLICDDHGMTVAWIATITDLFCALLLSLAFLAHIHARQECKPLFLGLSLLLFVAAFASKETAAIYPVIVAVYEFFYAHRLHDTESITLKQRLGLFLRSWSAWLPALIVFTAYMAFYRSLFPPFSSLMYVDPFSQPGRYLAMALPNLPVMFAALLSLWMPSLVIMVPGSLPLVAVFGLVMVGLLVWALLPYRRETTLWFCLTVFVLSLLPGLATDPGERLLYFPSIFGLFPVAWMILQLPSLKSRFMPASPVGVRTLGPLWGWYLLLSALILPVILLSVYPGMWIPSLAWPEKTVLEGLPIIHPDIHEHVAYLNTNSSYNTFYLNDIYRYHRGEYVDMRPLSSFNGRVSVRRESERVLVLRTEDRGWLNNMFARIVRSESLFTQGETYTNDLFTATIEETTPDRKDVLQVRFEFVLSLDDDSLVLIYYDGEAYHRWEPRDDWQLLNESIDPFSF